MTCLDRDRAQEYNRVLDIDNFLAERELKFTPYWQQSLEWKFRYTRER